MAAPRYPYRPDRGVAPGEFLEELLQERQLSAREFARRCGRSAKLIVEILAGKAPVEPGTALQFERVLGTEATVWLGMEAAYRLHVARAEEAQRLAGEVEWAARFPLREMEERGLVDKPQDSADAVRKLLRFFAAGSAEACRDRFAELAAVSYRHSPAFKSSEGALLAWLRVGELRADAVECGSFDRPGFVSALRGIRALTTEPIDSFLPEIERRCAAAGVAFVVAKPFKGVALSGVSRWLTPRKALIQQTLRHMANDHFWFTFYHEAAHLLLHSRKPVFIDGKGIATADPDEEEEANAWAANILVPQAALTRFIAGFAGRKQEVEAFAREQGIAPGIVVGQLQKRRAIHFSQMNDLKERYQWAD